MGSGTSKTSDFEFGCFVGRKGSAPVLGEEPIGAWRRGGKANFVGAETRSYPHDSHEDNDRGLMVGARGIEPPRPCGH